MHVLAEVLSFLDINQFQSFSGDIEFLRGLDCHNLILLHWLKNTTYQTLDEDIPFIFRISEQRNGLLHTQNNLPAFYTHNAPGDNWKLACYFVYKEWWRCGKLHRAEGLPAIVYHRHKEWWNQGKRHRKNGPALTCKLTGITEWWEHGKSLRVHNSPRNFISTCYRCDISGRETTLNSQTN